MLAMSHAFFMQTVYLFAVCVKPSYGGMKGPLGEVNSAEKSLFTTRNTWCFSSMEKRNEPKTCTRLMERSL